MNDSRSGAVSSPHLRRGLLLSAAAMGLIIWLQWSAGSADVRDRQSLQPKLSPRHASGSHVTTPVSVRLPGGTFRMGAMDSGAGDQSPVHRVELPEFLLDSTHVTNRQFARFVKATGHVTTAERRGWSMVFDPESGRWKKTTGAHWRQPIGAESSIAGRDDYPVVQVSWFDASAYASWVGKRLPTEAEYEYAARSGLADSPYPWGRELQPEGRPLANYWQGWFPQTDAGEDGYRGLSPVGAFPANRYGLYDVVGNAWCWCSDWYQADYYAASRQYAPRGPASGEHRVRRGGSWLSAANYGDGLRVSYRDHAAPEEADNQTGIRCAKSLVR